MFKLLTHMKNRIFVVAGIVSLMIFAIATVHVVSAKEVNILSGRDMTIGSTGQDVVVLQGLLSELGYLEVPRGVPLGYFGQLTQGALARYQSAQGVFPASGYFGPLTKIAMHSHFNSQNWLSLLGW